MKKMLKNIEILHPSLIGGDLNAPQRGAKNCRFFEKKPTIVPCHTAQNDILSVGPSVSFSTISTQDVALFCGAATKSGKNRLSPSVGNLDHENWYAALYSVLPYWISNIVWIKNEIIIYVFPNKLYHLLFFLKNHTNALYKTMADMTAVDYPEYKDRFEVVYHLLSPSYNARIRVKTLIDEITPVPSMTSLFNGINWMERETWDMFGIYFYNHPDLRRILTDYGFDGFPLLKNYPLSGYLEVRYDDQQKRVINEPIEMAQEFRNFDLLSPWVSRSSIED